MSFIPPCYKKTKASLPNVEMNVELGGLNYIRNSIKQNHAEFGIVVMIKIFLQFARIPLKKGKFNLYQAG